VPKLAVPEAEVTPLGLTGDVQAHPDFHGGTNQALLVVTAEGIEELIAQGFPLFFGALGENLTTRGLDRREMRIGQRYRVGDAVIELTKMRQPCSQLSVYGRGIQKAVYDQQVDDGDARSPRWGLGGFYARVVRTGSVRPGAPVALLDQLA
jgi:MOSC domain-containing protein YiiM